MKTSTHRILTTHVGSLPRSQPVVDLIFAQEKGDPINLPVFNDTMRDAVDAVVKRQIDAGIDIVSDGEMSKDLTETAHAARRLTCLIFRVL